MCGLGQWYFLIGVKVKWTFWLNPCQSYGNKSEVYLTADRQRVCGIDGWDSSKERGQRLPWTAALPCWKLKGFISHLVCTTYVHHALPIPIISILSRRSYALMRMSIRVFQKNMQPPFHSTPGPYLGILRPWAQENSAPPPLICSYSVMCKQKQHKKTDKRQNIIVRANIVFSIDLP